MRGQPSHYRGSSVATQPARRDLEGLVAKASALTPAAVLAMKAESLAAGA